MTTYAQYQDQASSEKIGLVILEASRRLMGWTAYLGGVYRLLNFDHQVIASIKDSGVALTAMGSESLAEGQFYHDRQNAILYLRATGSVNPNSRFMAMTFQNFYANVPVAAPYDLATGYQVEWLPLLQSDAQFGVEIDNKNLVGFAIEGSGKIGLANDQAYWKPIFDKWTFENQRCFLYSWNRDLPITEAKRVYRGRVQAKTYSTKEVSFSLKDLINELRAPVALTDLSAYPGAKIPPSMLTAKQRLVYGYVTGHRPTNIDQELPLSGYPLLGTALATNASPTVTGTGTSFLAQLSPGDELSFNTEATKYTVATVPSDTSLTLTENYGGITAAGKTLAIFHDLPKRYINRVLLVAGHSLKEPQTTVVNAITTSLFELADVTDIEAGDRILLSGETFQVSRVSGNVVKTSTASALLPPPGTLVTRLSISSVYLNNRLLTYARDYTYSPTTAVLTLNQLAEFNVAPVRPIVGTLSFNSTRIVTGTGTVLKSEVKPGDWVKRSNQSTWHEVLSVDSDLQLTLRTVAAYTSAGASDHKAPQIFEDDRVKLACDVIGRTENGASTGVFIKTAAQMVKSLLTVGGLADLIDTASFSVAQGDSTHRLGVVIPGLVRDTKPPTVRDVVNKINQSVLGSLYQNQDFQFSYYILSPKRDQSTAVKFTERDVLGFSVQSDSGRIVRTARVRYRTKEFDPGSLASSTAEVLKTSDVANYLSGATKEQIVETYLVDDQQAQWLANRWSFLLEIASSILTIDTKLQGARVAVNDRVDLSHPKLYERIGSVLSRKVSGVQASRKSISDAELEMEDLSNAFARCAVIAPNSASDWDESSDDDRIYNGYITDAYGMQGNDPDTFGANLVW